MAIRREREKEAQAVECEDDGEDCCDVFRSIETGGLTRAAFEELQRLVIDLRSSRARSILGGAMTFV